MKVAYKTEEGVASVARAISILECFGPEGKSLSLSELASRTGLYKSTLLRLCQTLLAHKFLRQVEGGQYALGPALLRLGGYYQRSAQPEELIRPVLQRLVSASGESASFSIRDGDKRVILYRIDSSNPIRFHLRPGDVVEIDKGAAGRVLLAFNGEPGPLYATIRKRLVWTTFGERVAEAGGTACPVFGPGETVAGALALTGPRARFTKNAVLAMERLLLTEAAELSAALGAEKMLIDPLQAALAARDRSEFAAKVQASGSISKRRGLRKCNS